MADRAWTWRHAITKSNLPPTTRHVLLTISCFMNEVGGGCYPTQKQLAEATGLSDRAIRTQLEIAESLGWIKREEHGFKGQKWRNHQYEASWPEGAEAGSAPTQKGAEGRSSGCGEGAEAGSGKVRKDVPTTSPITTPAAAAREKSDFNALSEKLIEAVGEGNIQGHGALVIGPIIGLIEAGCDLETDILPTIRAVSSRLKRPAGSWTYFVPAIREAHAARVEAGRGIVKPPGPEDMEKRWQTRLKAARHRGQWSTAEWGPAPGQPGSIVPKHLIQPGDGDGWREWQSEAA